MKNLSAVENNEEIKNMIEDFSNKTESDIRLLRLKDRKTLFSAYYDNENINIFSNKELDEIVKDTEKEGATRKYLRTGNGEMLFNTLIRDRDNNIYLLQSKHKIFYPKERRAFLWIMLFLCILIIALSAFPISRNITNPINKLIDASQKLASGKFGYSVDVKSGDEIGRLAANFNQMSERIRQLHENRKNLLADISHELRTPLARIQTDAEIIIDKNLSEEKRRDYLNDIIEEIRCMNSLIEDLFNLSKIDLGFEKLNLEDIEFSTLMNELYNQFEASIKRKNIEMEFVDRLNNQKIRADKAKIKQVISNLISNALQHTEEGGKIVITGHIVDGKIEISVKDNGKGIPEEELPKIFNRFYRVDKSRARDSGGSGLGLAICKRIIAFHKGDIRAESKLNEGTTITFTLPL